MLKWLFGGLGSALLAEKAPYVITLFIAALGWTALRTSDRLAQTPFLEYETTIEAARVPIGLAAAPNVSASVPLTSPAPIARGVTTSSPLFAKVRLRNVSPSHSFECFRLEFFSTAELFAPKGASSPLVEYHGRVAVVATVEAALNNNWRWRVEYFSPSADIALGVPLQAPAPFQVLIRPCDPAPKGEGDEKEEAAKSTAVATPVLLKKSTVTWYVEHELLTLWVGLLIWLLLLTALTASRAPTKEIK